MLEKIHLEHFKAFNILDSLDIKPITILCGTNSCGKSTILQSILLAKQTVESRQLGQRLQLNGRFVRLGTFENVIFEKKPENEIVLGFSFCCKKDSVRDLPTPLRLTFPLRFILEHFFSEKHLKIDSAEFAFYYRFTFKLAERRSPRTHLKPIIITDIQLKAETRLSKDEIIEGPNICLSLIEKDKYRMTWANTRNKEDKSGNKIVKVAFGNILPNSIFLTDVPRKKRYIHGPSFDVFIFSEFLENIFSTYRYIGPLREEPSRRYIYEDEVLEIGVKGENAAYICLSDYDNKLKDCYLYSGKKDTFDKCTETIKLGDALTAWLETMSIKGFIPIPSNEIVYLNLKSTSSKDTVVNIADVGFGVSQILPILLEGLRMPKGNTLMLEQPEIHLHPNLQMQMADYFISLALSQKRVIVETHSDHIVNRLVRRIVEDKKFNLNDLIRMYFIIPTPTGSVYEPVTIDPERGIVNWPHDFFDQTASELQRTIQAGLNKRMTNRSIQDSKL
jgi:predicted ATPase